MSDTVDRLKELLFDSEARELNTLAQRIDRAEEANRELKELTQSEKAVREEMQTRLAAVFERAGSSDKLEDSVAEIVDGALRKAEVTRHTQLASAIAPLVVRTVKTEIGNSKDELVEALYPMTGRMVKAYIASAMKDLANDINRRLEANPLMLRFRSLTTGRSMAELAMADAQRLHVEELYLIRRGTGELLARWPRPEGDDASSRDHVMSGILAAINEFSTEALGDEGTALRQIDLGERQLYLRASPVYLLAAKCSGSAPQPVEALLDEAFLRTIEKLNEIDDRDEVPARSERLLPVLSEDLSQQIETEYEKIPGVGPRHNPLKTLAWMAGIVVATWALWSAFVNYRTEHTREIASRVISSIGELSGYPVRLSVGYLGHTASVAGLAPSAEVKRMVGDKLKEALPGVDVSETLSVLPNVLDEIEPKIAGVRNDLKALGPEVARVQESVSGLDPKIATVRKEMSAIDPKLDEMRGAVSAVEKGITLSAVRQALDRAEGKLQRVARGLPRLAEAAGEDAAQTTVGPARAEVAALTAEIARLKGTLSAGTETDLAKALAPVTGRVHGTALKIAALAGAASAGAAPPAQDKAASLPEQAEALAGECDWLSEVTASAVALEAFKKSLPQPQARERLEAWTRANAVFFANGTDYRDGARAEETMASLANLLRETGFFVRIVGYTDEKGGQNPNNSLSKARAAKVLQRLLDLGVASRQLVALGRLDTRDISPIVGDNSPNRRVEFEIGFEGEGAQ